MTSLRSLEAARAAAARGELLIKQRDIVPRCVTRVMPWEYLRERLPALKRKGKPCERE